MRASLGAVTGIKFGLYDTLRDTLPKTEDGKTPPIWTLVAGATAGAVAHTLTYPLDTVRRRMQISGATGAATYTSILQYTERLRLEPSPWPRHLLRCLPRLRPRLSLCSHLSTALRNCHTLSRLRTARCVQVIVRTEGWPALFYGLAPTVMRSVPNLGIQFLMYEVIKSLLGLDKPTRQ